jgi:hypothetical protein
MKSQRQHGPWRRLAAYGAVGWIIEILMTGTSSALLHRDRYARANTTLWMLPIYGAGGLVLEPLSFRLHRRRWPWPLRALAYVPVIYGLEYSSGWLLRRLLGRCPWDYGVGRWRFSGLVRADYMPLWYLVACLFEPLRDGLTTTVICASPDGDHPALMEPPDDQEGPDAVSSAPESGQPAGGREPLESDDDSTAVRGAPPPGASGEDF